MMTEEQIKHELVSFPEITEKKDEILRFTMHILRIGTTELREENKRLQEELTSAQEELTSATDFIKRFI